MDDPKQFLITYVITETGWFAGIEQASAYARDYAPVHSSDTLDIQVEEME